MAIFFSTHFLSVSRFMCVRSFAVKSNGGIINAEALGQCGSIISVVRTCCVMHA